uniref:Pleckstrin homology domain containing O1 n=1 Tax=Molossus molossus TaxID=27622 RepID=A0A7J8CTB4_MOLMO|nr:pleckstrin homology domain containing O1 [Molossus molossus]
MMKKNNNSTKRGPQDGNHQSTLPEKVGWVRKFCGKGIFREIWKNRYVVLKGDQLYISEKEVGALCLQLSLFSQIPHFVSPLGAHLPLVSRLPSPLFCSKSKFSGLLVSTTIISAGKGHPLVRRPKLELEVECASYFLCK